MSSQSIQRQSINNQSFNPGTKRVNIKDNKSLSIFDALDANGDGVLGADESLGIVTAKNGKKYYKSKKIENNRYIVVDENGQKHTMSHDGVILSEAYLKQQAQKQQNDKNNKSKTNTNNQTKTNKQQKTQESKPQPTNKQQTNNQTKANNYQVSVFEQNDNGQNKKFVIAKNGKKYEFVKKIENNRYVVIDEKGEQRIMSHDGGILSGKYLAQTASQSDQNKAKKEFKKQQDKDGNAAKIADAVSVLWGSENRASVVKNDLDENQRKLNELARSSKNDKEYRANFKKMFGVEYNESAVVAYTANPTKENYEKAFGKGQRITDRVEDYNNSQDMGGAIVKAGAVIAATGVVGTLTGGVGLIGAAAIGACTSAAVNISDRLSSNNGLQGDDWGEIIEDAAIDSVTIGTAEVLQKLQK